MRDQIALIKCVGVDNTLDLVDADLDTILTACWTVVHFERLSCFKCVGADNTLNIVDADLANILKACWAIGCIFRDQVAVDVLEQIIL